MEKVLERDQKLSELDDRAGTLRLGIVYFSASLPRCVSFVFKMYSEVVLTSSMLTSQFFELKIDSHNTLVT